MFNIVVQIYFWSTFYWYMYFAVLVIKPGIELNHNIWNMTKTNVKSLHCFIVRQKNLIEKNTYINFYKYWILKLTSFYLYVND